MAKGDAARASLWMQECEVKAYREELIDAEKGAIQFRSLPWLSIGAHEDAALEKTLMALTIGRASFQRLELLNERQAAKRWGVEEEDVAAGFYLVAPDGSMAAAYVANVEGGKDWAGMLEERTIPKLRKAGKVKDESFINVARFDTDRFGQKENQFSDAMGRDFEGSLESLGVEVASRRLDEVKFKGGYAAAWRIPKAKRAPRAADSAEQVFMQLSFEDLAAAPFNNHAGTSLVKNIRDFTPVNNVEPGMPNQLDARDEIVGALIESWLAAKKTLAGLNDEESGIDASAYASPKRLQEERARAARTYENPKGNSKKLGLKPSESRWWMGEESEDGSREAMIVSRDMALIDGQHSSRNYGLVAQALSGSGIVTYEGEQVQHCSLSHFKGLFEERLKKEMRDSKAAGVDLKAALGAEGFESFVEWAKSKAQATMVTEPVATAKQAMELTYIANSSTAISKAAAAEHMSKAEVQMLVDAFNRQAERVGDPRRLSAVKGAGSDPNFATSPKLAKSYSELFGTVRACAKKVNQVGEDRPDWVATQAKKTLKRFGLEVTEGMVERVAGLIMMSGKIKSRDFMMAVANARQLGEVEIKLMEGRGARDGKAFSILSNRIAHEMLIKQKLAEKKEFEETTPDEKAYALVSAGWALREKIDKEWARIRSSSATKRMFESKATFENWMMVGLQHTRGELASKEALKSIERAVDHLIELKKEGELDLVGTHNDARERLSGSLKAEGSKEPNKREAFDNWRPSEADEVQKLMLLAAAMPGEGEAPKRVIKPKADVAGKLGARRVAGVKSESPMKARSRSKE